ncbi:S49 family peptidase [Buchnera aphidicola (Taiwanaphis decaspermi)]|uniref:S49 family peptidase n=1 Tax=Buchnera aphidicola TaxID=9 RepID=UPI0031B88404
MEFIYSYILFIIKTLSVLFFLHLFSKIIIIYILKKNDIYLNNTLKVELLNNHYKKLKNDLSFFQKKKIINQKNVYNKKSNLYILDYNDKIKKNKIKKLREEISSIILVAKKNDEVLLRLENTSDIVYEYGLVIAQLQRLRKKGIKLIISIDKIVSNGGYIIACVADHISASPFSIIGPINIVVNIPNIDKYTQTSNLNNQLNDCNTFTKLTLIKNNTKIYVNKIFNKLDIKKYIRNSFIKDMRPSLNLNKIFNQNYWIGENAINEKLIDSINTSDDILFSKKDTHNLLKIKYVYKSNIVEKYIVTLNKYFKFLKK